MDEALLSYRTGCLETHYHHLAGAPTLGGRYFPDPRYSTNLTVMQEEELEIEGVDGYVHIRCPASSPHPCSCGRYISHLDSMIIAVDGACPNNGTDQAITSACGVYLGPGADNWSWRVVEKEGQKHTSSRAELHAAIGALLAVLPFIGGGGQVDCSHCETPCRVRHVVIKSDSAYLVNSVTQYIDKWMTNGWRTAQRKPVRNRDLWEELIRLIHLIEDDLEAKVDFWHVPRGENQQADQLANDGLRSRRTLDINTFPYALRGFTVEEDAVYPYPSPGRFPMGTMVA